MRWLHSFESGPFAASDGQVTIVPVLRRFAGRLIGPGRPTLVNFAALLLPVALASACGNQTARAPNPTAYDWPDSLTYKIELVSESQHETLMVARYEETKELRFAVRNDRYVVWNDSVSKEARLRGEAPRPAQVWPEDTLRYFVRLSRLGEILESEPSCDPAVPECGAALPSALPLELRRIIPRLPVWWPPKGHQWVDTLWFDDLPRARGSRGTVITDYRAARDTQIGGRGYWVVTWTSVRRAFGRGPSGGGAEPPVEEHGTVYVDKERLVPAYAGWLGALAAPPALRALGVTGTGFRGRAYLAGSVFDTLMAAR